MLAGITLTKRGIFLQSECNLKPLTSLLSFTSILALKQLHNWHMTSHSFHNAHVQLLVSLWQILPILIFRIMSSIGHLPIALVHLLP